MSLSPTGEYIQALLGSQRLGGQVAAHRHLPAYNPHHERSCDQRSDKIRNFLECLGIPTLYSHQLEAINSLRQGRHTVVATPTASGKSLIYNLTFFELLSAAPQTRGLYIFPLKALTQDQLKTFNQWAGAVFPPESEIHAAVYDGDTNAYQRRKIRGNPPSVVMTNPDMLHLALLPYHAQWAEFFKHLKLVVVDEVHTYRGYLGSHMCQVLRRLQRVCHLYGSSPTFVFSSATLANADQLASQLTGLNFTLIDQSGAPRGERHTVLIDPEEGPARTAILLLKAAIAREMRVIVYTQSRKLAELITIWVQQGQGALSQKVGVYRAGLRAGERRKIENDLKSGRLLAVVSTSALELGIDIGDLDLCVLIGYPGSMIATQQRAGRVGRKGQEAALLFIAGQDALDQYYIRNPKAFFSGKAESAVVNPYNAAILKKHLICAAAERPLDMNEPWLQGAPVKDALGRLLSKGDLISAADGNHLFARDKRPHRSVDLRGIGRRYRIILDKAVLGEINGHRLYHETHPGAVYLHQGCSYLVRSIDESTQCVHVQAINGTYYTRVRSDTDVLILDVLNNKFVGNTVYFYGKLKVTDQVIGFERVSTQNGRKIDYTELHVPPVTFETEGLWFTLDNSVCDRVRDENYDLLGALHAAEHASIGVMPLLILVDRNDIGGLATPMHPQVGSAAIFFYDGIPGGAGFSRLAYDQALKLMQAAQDAIEGCDCDDGCPACVHSPKCGSGNQPMDKQGGAFLLRELARSGCPAAAVRSPALKSVHRPFRGSNHVSRVFEESQRYGVFDLETQQSAEKVGGWHMAHKMKVSCSVVYDALDDSYTVYEEARIQQLIDHLKQMDLVVGFNIKRFDFQVLKGYSDYNFKNLNTLDLLELVYRQLGFRLSLDHLTSQTLNARKCGSGLDALRWWKEGKIEKIIAYCQKDVMLTRELYVFARDHGYLIYQNNDGEKFRVFMPEILSLS